MAARFWIGPAGGDNLWSNINNWSATSGGGTAAAIPTNADDVTFDGAANAACTINTTARVAKTLTVASGYTNTITFSVNLSVSGSITIANSAHTMTGAGLLRMITTGTWTTNGKTIGVGVVIGATTSFTCTLANALTVSGDLALTNTTSTTFSGNFLITATSCTISGTQTVNLSGHVQINGVTTIADNPNATPGAAFEWRTWGLTMTGVWGAAVTPALLVFNGTGTWSGSGALGPSVTVAAAAVLTISGAVDYSSSSNLSVFTFTAGASVTVTGSTVTIDNDCTLNTSGMSWNNLTVGTAATIAGQALSITGTLTISAATTITPAVTAGTISQGAALTLTAASTATTFTQTAAVTLTLNGLLTVTGTFTLPNAAVTFAGSAGWTVGTLTNTAITVTRITTFTAGRTYTVTTALNLSHAAAQTVRFTWTAASTAYIVLAPGATQNIGFSDPTNLDASGGQRIYTYKGAITTSPNWSNVIPGFPTIAAVF